MPHAERFSGRPAREVVLLPYSVPVCAELILSEVSMVSDNADATGRTPGTSIRTIGNVKSIPTAGFAKTPASGSYYSWLNDANSRRPAQPDTGIHERQ